MSKKISEIILPEDVKYTEDHDWTRIENGNLKIGITDYAQDQLGEIVFVEMPEVGDSFEKQEEFGSLESVKAVVEMYIPVGGEVVSVNEQLEDAPELVNEDPYGQGWMIEVKPSDPSELDSLLTKETYLETLKGSD